MFSLEAFDKLNTIAVVGLGYVGLPLAVEFGKKITTIGLDLSAEKVEAFRRNIDLTGDCLLYTSPSPRD